MVFIKTVVAELSLLLLVVVVSSSITSAVAVVSSILIRPSSSSSLSSKPVSIIAATSDLRGVFVLLLDVGGSLNISPEVSSLEEDCEVDFGVGCGGVK